jgi:two-component system response regulator AtoC
MYPARVEVLVVDDDAGVRGTLRALLTRGGHRVIEADDGQSAIDVLAARSVEKAFDLVITDLMMPRADGFAVLRQVRERHPRTPVVMLTAEGSIRGCVAAIRAGAFNFLTKPFHVADLEGIVKEAAQAHSGALRPGSTGAPASTGLEQSQLALVGQSEALLAVIETVERLAGNRSTVLITGESGTGKDVVARLLHVSSGLAAGPFVAINCGAIPETLIESELFGHAKGAFTGASEARVGRFLQADGGTLFLDEIGELPLALQVKLLRVLQDREVTPVGDARSRTVDVRVIAATNRDLEAMVKEGRFRQDLFYRIEVLPIRLPALRERRDDIPLLARHFLDLMNRRLKRDVALSEGALTLMVAYDWPGNVREMENLLERLVVLTASGTIAPSDLPERFRRGVIATKIADALAGENGAPIDLQATMTAIESSLMDHALRQADGNKTRAAGFLGLSRTTFLNKLKRQG